MPMHGDVSGTGDIRKRLSAFCLWLLEIWQFHSAPKQCNDRCSWIRIYPSVPLFTWVMKKFHYR